MNSVSDEVDCSPSKPDCIQRFLFFFCRRLADGDENIPIRLINLIENDRNAMRWLLSYIRLMLIKCEKC